MSGKGRATYFVQICAGHPSSASSSSRNETRRKCALPFLAAYMPFPSHKPLARCKAREYLVISVLSARPSTLSALGPFGLKSALLTRRAHLFAHRPVEPDPDSLVASTAKMFLD